MTAATVEPAIGQRTQGADPGSPLRQPGADGRAARARRGARAARARGRGAGGRGASYDGQARARSATPPPSASSPPRTSAASATAGAIVTDDDEVAADARRTLRAHGSGGPLVPHRGRLQLAPRRAPGGGAARAAAPPRRAGPRRGAAAAAAYAASRARRAGRRPSSETAGGESCYHLYVVREPESRDALAAAPARGGVETRAYYTTPLHRQPALAGELGGGAASPTPSALAAEGLALPMGQALDEAAVDGWSRRSVRSVSAAPGEHGGQRRAISFTSSHSDQLVT